MTLRQMLGVMLLALPLVGLVGTNNLSTAIIIMGIAVILIFVASPGYLRFVLIGAGGARFSGSVLKSGILPPGASGHLAAS